VAGLARRAAWLVGLGVAAGLTNGLLGIGGGTVLVPILVFWYGMRQHQAHGTTVVVILVTAVASSLVYLKNRFVQPDLVWKVMTGGAVGAYAGARLMPHLRPQTLRRVYGSFMVLAGLRMLVGG